METTAPKNVFAKLSLACMQAKIPFVTPKGTNCQYITLSQVPKRGDQHYLVASKDGNCDKCGQPWADTNTECERVGCFGQVYCLGIHVVVYCVRMSPAAM